MIILTLRTDNPEAEVGLYDGHRQIAYEVWTAHRQLAEGLHSKIRDVLAANNCTLKDLEAIAVYKGPGSFTGLRIGMSVANTLSFGLSIPIVGVTKNSAHGWQTEAIRRLSGGKDDNAVVPEYGAPVHITPPKSK